MRDIIQAAMICSNKNISKAKFCACIVALCTVVAGGAVYATAAGMAYATDYTEGDRYESKQYAHESKISQHGKIGTLSVTGSAMDTVEPDTLVISFGVETKMKTASAALRENAQDISAAVTALENLGIYKDEISTRQFSIWPDYTSTYDDAGIRQNVLTGYVVKNTILVETDMVENAGKILDGAVNAGVNDVDYVKFVTSPEVQKTVRDSLIGEAVSDAKERANLALDPVGYKIIGVKTIMVDFGSFGLFDDVLGGLYDSLESNMKYDSMPTQIYAGDQEFSTSVDVVFLIAPTN